jgi:hypothetical protein
LIGREAAPQRDVDFAKRIVEGVVEATTLDLTSVARRDGTGAEWYDFSLPHAGPFGIY